MDARVKEIPEFRPLVARVPLPARIAERKDAFLGPRPLFIPPRSADGRVKIAARKPSSNAPVFNAPQQRCVPHANGFAPSFSAASIGVHNQLEAQLRRVSIPKLDHFPEFISRYRYAAAGNGIGPG